MSVTVTPETFTLVNFDAAEIAAVVEALVPAIGLPADTDVRIEVDEATPLGRASVTSYDDPVVISVESGATRRARCLRRSSRVNRPPTSSRSEAISVATSPR